MKKYINAVLWAVGAVCVVASLALSAAYAVGADSFISLRIGPDGSGTAPVDTLEFVNPNGHIHFQHAGEIAFDESWGLMKTHDSLYLSADYDDGTLNSAGAGDTMLVLRAANPNTTTSGIFSTPPHDASAGIIVSGTNEATGEAQVNCILLGESENLSLLGLPETTLGGNIDAGVFSAELNGTGPESVYSQMRVNRTGEAFMSNMQGAKMKIDPDGSAAMSGASTDNLGNVIAQSSVKCLANGDVVVQLGPLP